MAREIDSDTDDYSAKLLKLIPAEVSAAYLSINSLVSLEEGFSGKMWLSLIALTLMCYLYLTMLRGVRNQVQAIFTTISFPVWAANISAARFANIDPTIFGIILILITVASPFFVINQTKKG